MLQLSRFLGFFPSGKYDAVTPWFDLKEGTFQEHRPNHPYFLDPILSERFYALLSISLEDVSEIKLTAQQRKSILEALIGYYELHHTQGSRIKSHEILNEVLS